MKKIIVLVMAVVLLTGCEKFDWKPYISIGGDHKPLDYETFNRIATEVDKRKISIPKFEDVLDIKDVNYYVFQVALNEVKHRSYALSFLKPYREYSKYVFVTIDQPEKSENLDDYMKFSKLLTTSKKIDGVKYYYGVTTGYAGDIEMTNHSVAFYKNGLVVNILTSYDEPVEIDFEYPQEIYKIF